MARLRKYQSVWTIIKTQGEVSVQLQPLTMTADQLLKAFAGFKRAISKEKYEDIMFKHENPGITLDFDLNKQTFEVSVKLSDNKQQSIMEIL